jgi:hypothetical protein
MMVGSAPGQGDGHDARTRLQVVGLGGRLVADQDRRGTIHDARRIAGVVHVLDALHLRVTLQRHRVEAHGAHLVERRLERGQALHRGARLDELVFVQNRLAQPVLHRHHRTGEAAFGARGGGALLRLQREGIDVIAAEPFHRRDQVGADALRHEQGLAVGLGVHRPGAAVGADRHAAHALHAAGHDQVFPARAHFLRRHVHGLQTRGAEAVELHAGALEVPAGLQRRHLGQHRALFAHGRDDAHDDVVHLRGVEVVAALQLGQQTGQQVDRLDLVQAAVLLALAARGADGIKNKGFTHGASPVGMRVTVQGSGGPRGAAGQASPEISAGSICFYQACAL